MPCNAIKILIACSTLEVVFNFIKIPEKTLTRKLNSFYGVIFYIIYAMLLHCVVGLGMRRTIHNETALTFPIVKKTMYVLKQTDLGLSTEPYKVALKNFW